MENTPRILVAVPYHSAKRYCLNQLFDSLNSLTYPNKEIIIRHDPCEYGSKNAVKKQREFMRILALEKGFDYLYFLGADTLPPADVLERLLKTAIANDIKIIGGVYWGRHNAENGDPGKAVAWIHDMSQEEQTKIFNTPNTLLKVDGQGMDAILIHREVLEKISWLQWEQNDDDYPFYDLAKAAGYACWIDTGIQCKHFFKTNAYSESAKIVEI
jgi:hypothetical protein